MELKLYFLLTLSLIILFSIGTVAASENTTIDNNTQTVQSDITAASSYEDGQVPENEVLADSIQDSFEYNQIVYDFDRITYESNAFIYDKGVEIGRALLPNSTFAWTLTINTSNAYITPDSRLPNSHHTIAPVDDNGEIHYPGPDDPYELVISGLKLPEGLEYVNHHVDEGTYNPTDGSWIIDNLPENSLVSLTVISKVMAKTGQYIPGFYVEYEKRYPSYIENVGFYIWECKLVLSNVTNEINYTEEILGHIPKVHLPSGSLEVIRFNESYDGVNVTDDDGDITLVADNVVIGNETYKITFKLTEKVLDNFYMIIDENGTVSNYVYYDRSSIAVYDNDLRLLFTISWSTVVTESGTSWRSNRDYKYSVGDYSRYRVVTNSAQDNNNPSNSSSNSNYQSGDEPNGNGNPGKPSGNGTPGKPINGTSYKPNGNRNVVKPSNNGTSGNGNTTSSKLKYFDIADILSSSVNGLIDYLTNDNSENNSAVTLDDNKPIFIAVLMSALIVLIYVAKRRKD